MYRVAALGLLLLLQGCEREVYVGGGGRPDQLRWAQEACTRDLIGFIPPGDAPVVAWQVTAHFDFCMSSYGWISQDWRRVSEDSAEIVVAVQRVRRDDAAFKSCISRVRQRPETAPILSHLVDMNSHQFSTEQKQDSSTPSAEESKAIFKYIAQSSECYEKYDEKVKIMSINASEMNAEIRGEYEYTMQRLARREISWGDAARELEELHKLIGDGPIKYLAD